MSTKIYEAYRIPTNRTNEFTVIFDSRCRRATIDFLNKVKCTEETIKETRKQLSDSKLYPINHTKFSDDEIGLINQLARGMKESKLGRNDLFNLDCSFNFWFQREWVYIIPYVHHGVKLEGKLPFWCGFYGYWNNIDPEEGISEEEWAKRGAVWEEIALNDWNRTRFAHIALELNPKHGNIGLNKLLHEMIKDENKCFQIEFAAIDLFSSDNKDKK